MSKQFGTKNIECKVLISGAGIAGLTTAYWLAEYGFQVTVIEQADKVREGGYPVDLRGSAVKVAKRMGLHSEIKKSSIHPDRITFKSPAGDTEAVLPLTWIQPNNSTEENFELNRGILNRIIYEQTETKNIRFVFADSIHSMKVNSKEVNVLFHSGKQEDFHLIIGADGIHSNTRLLSFGKEDNFIHYLGYNFYGSTISNRLELSREALVYSAPGCSALFYEISGGTEIYVLLATRSAQPLTIGYDTKRIGPNQIKDVFIKKEWNIPYLKEELTRSKDEYYDMVAQVRLPDWSKDRVVLVGDAAYAPSFLSGQGTSLALIGAYVLAGELSTKSDFRVAFYNYEKKLKDFVKINQELAYESASILIPATKEEIDKRNQIFTALQSAGKQEIFESESIDSSDDFHLPNY